ncbi:hypothetical protein [Sphingobacterium multivorum]|uniref:hypothetical protein n=1 Tax=Sphingobacterium multivorum TaxID=28454 RepID=UPI0036BD3953
MKANHIYECKGKYILYENRIHEVLEIQTSGSVFVLNTDISRINVLKKDEGNFLESILVAVEREDLQDYEREAPAEVETPVPSNDIQVENQLQKSAPTEVISSIPQENSVTVIPEEGFLKSPIETTIHKHGSELASMLMDTMKKVKAGIIKKDQAESICSIAREMTSLAKEEINLIRTLRQ